ncbi:MAG TPA: hypothetical protein DHV26_12110 [Cytophagales bacterium]|nr:hypothetical protein [Cytophagales bacterium]
MFGTAGHFCRKDSPGLKLGINTQRTLWEFLLGKGVYLILFEIKWLLFCIAQTTFLLLKLKLQ